MSEKMPENMRTEIREPKTENMMAEMPEAMIEIPSSELIAALPNGFDFYGMGEVRRELESATQDTIVAVKAPATSSSEVDDSEALGNHVAFALFGDVQGVLVFSYPAGPANDPSMFTEIGNTIASQFATRLSNGHGLGVHISPPRSLSAARYAEIRNQTPRQRYHYLHSGIETDLEVRLLLTPNQEASHV